MIPELEHEWFHICAEKHGCEEEREAWDAFKIACEIERLNQFQIVTGQLGDISFYDPRFTTIELKGDPPYRKLYRRSFKIGEHTLVDQRETWDLVSIRTFEGFHDMKCDEIRRAVFTTGYCYIPQECCDLRINDLADYEIGVEHGLMPNFYISRWKWLVMRSWRNSVDHYNDSLKLLGGDTGEV